MTLIDIFIVAAIIVIIADVFFGTFVSTFVAILVAVIAGLAKFEIIPSDTKSFLIAQLIALTIGVLVSYFFQKKIRTKLSTKDIVSSHMDIIFSLNLSISKGNFIDQRVDGVITKITIDESEELTKLPSGTTVKVVNRSVGEMTVISV